MKIQIHHPRLLIMALLVVGVLTTVGIIVADWDKTVLEPQSFTLPVSADLPPPTDAEVADAVQIARDAGWVSTIAGDQEWTLIGSEHMGQPKWVVIPGSDQLGIRFTAVWRTPVQSDGPWYRSQCQMTRLREGYTTFTNIHALKILVDMNSRTPIIRAVSFPFLGEQESQNPVVAGVPVGKETKVIRHTGTKNELYRGDYDSMPQQFKECPPGAEDYKT